MTDENATSTEEENIEELFEDEPKEETVEATEEPEEVKGEEEAAPPAEKEPKLVPIAALHDVRRKEQQLREENEALKAQIPQKSEAPDMYEDPEAYKKWVKDEALSEIQASQNVEYEAKVDKSRSSMLEKHEDYEQMEKTFVFLTGFDENLVSEMKAHADPAQYAYDKGREYLEAQKETLKAELIASGFTKAEAEEEAEETVEQESKKVNAPSLATATSVASNSAPLEKEESLNEMFGDQAY